MKNAYWFALAAGALAVAFLVKSPYMAFAMYAFLLLIALANLSSLAWLAGLDCERSITHTTLQQGEDTDVEITVKNTRGWPIPWIFFEDYHPADFPRRGDNKRIAILMPGRSVTIRYTLTCPRRGYHRIGPLLMESGDLFGLQKRFRTGERQEYVAVLPTVAYIETFNISAKRPQGPVRISNRVYADPTRINNIREYVPGDPLNTIHWKATARTGTLHVKTHDPSSVQGGTLILDLHEDSYVPEEKEQRMELAITTTASIAYLLQMSGEQVGMITNARDAAEVARYEVAKQEALSRMEADQSVLGEDETTRISPLSVATARSPIQAMRIIENLARVLPGRGLDAERMVLSEFRRLPRDAALLPVVPQVTESLALTLASMKESGFNVTVFLIKHQKGYEEAARLLAPYDIHVFHIEHEWNLHEISPAKIGQ
ncbi:MAG TPA: DUF58 domain-containing protein [Candidatus Hydrogenedentes bacterium]|nr:DUF58 domain-containing protein [Candidatus Hydrogenedentota bacterium]